MIVNQTENHLMIKTGSSNLSLMIYICHFLSLNYSWLLFAFLTQHALDVTIFLCSTTALLVKDLTGFRFHDVFSNFSVIACQCICLKQFEQMFRKLGWESGSVCAYVWFLINILHVLCILCKLCSHAISSCFAFFPYYFFFPVVINDPVS